MTNVTSFLHPRPGRRAFTMIELLVVMAIIGGLAAIVIPLTAAASRKRTEARVKSQLQEYITAIEAYHAKFGSFPPDNVLSRTATFTNINAITNQLFYELTGTLVDDRSATFRTPDHQESIGSAVVKQYFNVDGFMNSGADPKEVKSFLPKLKPDRYAEISSKPDVEVLVVPVAWPKTRTDHPVPAVKGLNPWRYVSTNPTNNPGRFDLWAEFVEGRKIKVISNWSRDIFEKP